MNKRIKVALTISIVLNVLLGGMVLGVSCHLFPPAHFNIEDQLAKLPQDKRTLFESIMGPAKVKMDAERTQVDDAKKEALRILKADPFNEEAYLTQTQHIDDMRTQMKRHIAESVAELAKHLEPGERAILADIVSHPPFTMPPAQPSESTPAKP